MAPEQKQQQLVAKLTLIEDKQERLAWVVDRARKIPPLSEEEKTEPNRVQGCVSRVWLVGSVEDGHCRFRLDADSTLVKGLAWLLCEVADGGTPAEIVAFEARLLEDLHLADQLSPTRRNGLEQVQLRIKEFARANLQG